MSGPRGLLGKDPTTHIARLTLNQPEKKNCYDPPMRRAMAVAMNDVAEDDDMKGIIGRLREHTFTPDGFYRTGDLGVLDHDGFLFFKGRADDMFKVSDATVYPSEVEAALRSLPFVAQVFVTDVLDETTNRDLVGATVLCRTPTDTGELDRAARERLSAFKVPKRWAVLASLDEVPMMATGKVDKAGLQQLIRSKGKAA